VDLGEPRLIASLQLVTTQDLQYTLALANTSSSGGALTFVTVAQRACDPCVMNPTPADGEEASARMKLASHVLSGGPALATHVKLTVTWSSDGGVGGCFDLCDWATNVYELRALSPGVAPVALPLPPLAPPPPPAVATAPAAPACASPSETLVAQDTLPDSFVLRGDATAGAPASGRHGLGSVTLTAARPLSAGAVEFSRVIRPRGDCDSPCADQQRMLLVTVYVWLGSGSGSSMPGEGLVISLVDASRQTPGATRYLPGCGTRAALPAHALSVVLDTSDSDPRCDEPGTGARIVSTLGDADEAPPLVLCSTLEMSTAAFRRNNWTAVQFAVDNPAVQHYVGYSKDPALLGSLAEDDPDAAAARAAVMPLWAPVGVYVDGDELLDPRALMSARASELRATNATLDAFYVVVSARTGDTSSDAHAVSAVHVECRCLEAHTTALGASSGFSLSTWVDNWSSLRQPLTPVKPTAERYPRSPPPWAQSGTRSAGLHSMTHSNAALSGFLPAFCVTATLLLCVAAARVHCRARTGQLPRAVDVASWKKLELLPLAGCVDEQAEAEAPPPLPEPAASVHVCLSCRHADWRLADALHDKLRLAGLNTVFRRDDADARDGSSSHCADDADAETVAELVRAVRCAPVFMPIISLHSLARMAAAAGTAAAADVPLAECLAALCCRDADGAVRLVHPLLASAELTPSACGKRKHWCSLADDPAYAAALAALPDEVPAATVALVDASFRAALGRPLPARFACLTLRQILLGRTAATGGGAGDEDNVLGMLSGQPFALNCAEGDFSLYITRRFLPPVFDAAGLEQQALCLSSDSRRVSGDERRASGDSRRASGDERRASGDERRASGDGRWASGDERRCSGEWR
jgi:hypothetical protein